MLRGKAFTREGGIVETGEGGNGGWEGRGLLDKCGEGLGGLAVLDLDGAVFNDGVGGGVEAGGLEVDGDVVGIGACAFGLSPLGDEALGGLAEAGAKRLAFREHGGKRTAHEGDAVKIHRLP